MHSHPADPLPGFPSVFLWAWEEPENLQFLDPHSTGIAFLARTVILHDGSVTVRPRLEPMRYPTGAVLMAVVRVEAGRAELPSTESTAAAVADAAAIFNRQLPLALLKQAAASPQLPPNVRGELATVVYVRSAMMQPQPRFEDIYRILKSPGMREHVNSGFQRSEGMAQIDDYRDNWWCAIKEQSPAAPADGDEPPTMLKEVYRGSAPEATFLSPAEREQARQEATELSAVPTGPIGWPRRLPNGRKRSPAIRAFPKRCTWLFAPPASAAPTKAPASFPSAPSIFCASAIPRAHGRRRPDCRGSIMRPGYSRSRRPFARKRRE